MNAPLCKSKSDRDRLRQRRGESRKAQIKEIRRQVKRWQDGASSEDCMAVIRDALHKVAGHE